MTTLLSRFVAVDEPSAARMAALLAAMSRSVRDEPGHVAYEAFRAQEDPTVLYVQETWATPEDANGHVRRVASVLDQASQAGPGRGRPDRQPCITALHRRH